MLEPDRRGGRTREHAPVPIERCFDHAEGMLDLPSEVIGLVCEGVRVSGVLEGEMPVRIESGGRVERSSRHPGTARTGQAEDVLWLFGCVSQLCSAAERGSACGVWREPHSPRGRSAWSDPIDYRDLTRLSEKIRESIRQQYIRSARPPRHPRPESEFGVRFLSDLPSRRIIHTWGETSCRSSQDILYSVLHTAAALTHASSRSRTDHSPTPRSPLLISSRSSPDATL